MALDGHVAIVTGAGRGIGRAISQMLAMQGAIVIGTSRTASELEEVQRSVSASGRGIFHPLEANVGEEDDVKRVVNFAEDTGGHIDILVNNAGTGSIDRLVDTTTDNWDRQMTVNARGVFLFTREVAKRMVARQSGSIVNISSIAGKRAGSGLAAYSASKFAAVGFTEAIGRELRKHGVRVYSLCPGAVATALRREAIADEDVSKIMQPGDIATLVCFLVGGAGRGLKELILEIN